MQTGTQSRGFASMNQAKQREIARKGGKAAHAKGTAHEFNADEARAAGRKGGERVSTNREHMSRIGRIGGKASAARRQGPEAGGEGMEERSHPGEGGGEMTSSAIGTEQESLEASAQPGQGGGPSRWDPDQVRDRGDNPTPHGT